MQMYMLMVDYGRGPRRPMGFAADVRPECTRQNIVDEVRDILASENKSVAFVKFIDGNYCEDVTDEILRDARDETYNPGLVSLQDLIDGRHDHERALRNEVVS